MKFQMDVLEKTTDSDILKAFAATVVQGADIASGPPGLKYTYNKRHLTNFVRKVNMPWMALLWILAKKLFMRLRLNKIMMLSWYDHNSRWFLTYNTIPYVEHTTFHDFTRQGYRFILLCCLISLIDNFAALCQTRSCS